MINNNNDDVFITGLTTDQDNIDTIVTETTSAIENKTEKLHFHNRAERRAFAKKLGKSGRSQLGTISETARKLNYIDLIQKLREKNKENENENTTKNS